MDLYEKKIKHRICQNRFWLGYCWNLIVGCVWGWGDEGVAIENLRSNKKIKLKPLQQQWAWIGLECSKIFQITVEY